MTEIVETYNEVAAQVVSNALLGPREALAGVCLSHALGASRRRVLELRKAAAIVIIVPTEEWVEPVASAVQAIHPRAKIIDPSQKRVHKATEAKTAARFIAAGSTVVGVAHDPDLLPDVLLAAATARVEVGSLTTKLLAKAMSLCLTGRLPSGLQGLDLSKADFDLLCACMPKGATKKEALANLTRVLAKPTPMKNQEDLALPSLESAVEYGDARRWALELRDDIVDLKAGKITWADVDRGCILEGPPGSGKTTFARILGAACGLEVIVGSVSEFFASSAGYLDSVIKAQRQLFERAAEAAPCILFLDEINAMPDLATISPRGKDWWTPVVMDFYLLLDSMISTREGIIVIGATNRIEDISPVLLRPGRLERSIHIGTPDEAGLTNVLRTQLGSDLLDDDIGPLARMGVGATAAVAMDWVRSARRISRRAGRAMTLDDLVEQISPKNARSVAEKHRIAVHEAGHGIIGTILGLSLSGITIAPMGNSGGRTSFERAQDSLLTREHLEQQVIMSLAGNAAEIVILGAASIGSGGDRNSDLAQATCWLAMLRASYGLAGSLTWRAPPRDIEAILARDRRLRAAVETDLQRLHRRALTLVRKHRKAISATAALLRTAGSVSAEGVTEILQLYDHEFEGGLATAANETDESIDKSIQKLYRRTFHSK
jgi:hypothetical protein